MKLTLLCVLCSLLFATQIFAETPTLTNNISQQEAKTALGKALFFDTRLSEPNGQSCASCHSPDKAFSDPKGAVISAGAKPGRFGNRHAPSLAYAKLAPPLHFDVNKNRLIGGQFWDGRVDTLAQQAALPLTNPVEMNNSKAGLLAKLKTSVHAKNLTRLYGADSLNTEDSALAAVTDALAAYQQGPEFAKFTSKYDLFVAGKVALSPLEQRGLRVFQDNGKCMDCHNQSGEHSALSDFSFHNIGIPRNVSSPFFAMTVEFNPAGTAYIDAGLSAGGRKLEGDISEARGRFRTPSLRNVAITAPYMHNGVFKTLREVVEFYSTRDVSDRWGSPEIKDNLETTFTGNLHLNDADINALLAFLDTLTDDYQFKKSVVGSINKN